MRLGVSTHVDRLRWENRDASALACSRWGSTPRASTPGPRPGVCSPTSRLCGSPTTSRLLVGIDRLDYTKGIPRRLLAFERLLREHPRAARARPPIQVAVPSRAERRRLPGVPHQVDEPHRPDQRRIRHAQLGSRSTTCTAPSRARSWSPLYRAADVMLVTPLRDGMNLVAKEFVAARSDEDGVLVLSEFAGAAAELAEPLHVNPFDIGRHGRGLPPGRRHAARRAPRADAGAPPTGDALRRPALGARCSSTRSAAGSRDAAPQGNASSEARGGADGAACSDVRPLILLLDYDGSLVPFAPIPDLAAPDRELLALLSALTARPGTEVHLVSGRKRDDIERWFADLPIALHAEHGLWSRPPGGVGRAVAVDVGWKDRVLPILLEYADWTPGALVEEKPAGLAWHFRMADPQYGPAQATSCAST